MNELTCTENAKLYIESTFHEDVEIQQINEITFKVILDDGILFVDGMMFDEVMVYNFDLGIKEVYKIIDPSGSLVIERVS